MPETTITRRRWPAPAAVAAATLLAALLPDLWVAADLDPTPLLTLTLLAPVAALLGGATLLVWLFAAPGLSATVRMTLGGTALGVGGVFFALLDRVEFTGTLAPVPHFIWERRPAAALAEHLAKPPPADPLPRADLTYRPGRDFPRYRGPDGDGVVPARVAGDWSARPPRLLWRHPCGGGYSGFAVAGNVAVTLEQRGDHEAVVCYDRATGRERWAYPYEAKFARAEILGGPGPRATPAVAGGEVFSLGATGELVCLDGDTGRPNWRLNVLDDCGARPPAWGVAGSPLVVGEKVIVTPGADAGAEGGRAVAAYDRVSGERVWAAGSHPAGYASPQLARLLGRPQVLVFDTGGLAGHDPDDGRELWRYARPAWLGLNMAQPVVLPGDRVFVSSLPAEGGALVQVRREGGAWAAAAVWQNRLLAARFASPVAGSGFVYGLSGPVLVCLDAATGRRRWRGGYFPSGQVLRAGDVLVVTDEGGGVTAVEANPARYRELGRFHALAGVTRNTPALAGRQLFVRNRAEMACYELPE